jgi:hypothetical protein
MSKPNNAIRQSQSPQLRLGLSFAKDHNNETQKAILYARVSDQPQGERTMTTTKIITVTWTGDYDDGGRLIARCDEDHTLNSDVVRWPEPINAGSDSWAIAEAVTEINGAKILAVDHDGEFVHVTVDGHVLGTFATHQSGEDIVETDGHTYRTYTAGTQDPLYVGTDADDARESLEMSESCWNELLMSDPIDS